ncbi:ECF RNA polymerase sigma-E factor [mine drainage metagenome]|uniref:ECF RNA polymerase sigma-E factor n=1 Tax=mine drainage metagenome TaxID=410659 RepID=A0A1J5T2P1_9ZZZZ
MPPVDAPSLQLRLVAAARAQEAAAWDELLKAQQLPLYAYVAEFIRDREMAYDIVQETFLAAVRHIGTLREDGRFVSWLFGIAHQKCLQHFRTSRRRLRHFDEDAQVDDDWADEGAVDSREQLLGRERTEEFFSLLDALPAAQRSTLLLFVLEEFSLEEIATITGVPLGTVKSRLHHAKRALRERVEKLS